MRQVFISGTSRGIGLAVAYELLDRGYAVTGTSTSGDSPIKHAAFTPLELQLHRESSILECIQALSKSGQQFFGLINNAAVLLEDWDVPGINMTELRKTFEVNVFGTIQLTEGLLDTVDKGGHIINVGSGWGSVTDVNLDTSAPHYKLSKASLHLYTRLLAERVRKRNIRVSAIDPGWVRSDMGTPSAPKLPETAAIEIADLLEANCETGKFWRNGELRSW